MSIIISVTAFDDCIRLTIITMDSNIKNDVRELEPNTHPQSVVVESEPIEAPSEVIMVRQRE